MSPRFIRPASRLSPDGETLYTANNLGDTLGVLSDLRDTRRIDRVSLVRPRSNQFVYPYDVRLLTRAGRVAKVYVSLWGDGSVAAVDPTLKGPITFIKVGSTPDDNDAGSHSGSAICRQFGC